MNNLTKINSINQANIQTIGQTDIDIFIKSLNFATIKHSSQRRKNKNRDPYVNHVIDVCNILSMCGIKDTEILCAALLHDTIEDTSTTYDELLNEFGKNIADIVLECSDDKSLDKVTRKKLQIEHAKHISDKAKAVKLADKYSNMKDLLTDPPTSWNKNIINGYMIWSFECCKNLYGVNNCNELDNLLINFFIQHGVSTDNNKLNQYYLDIGK